MSAPPDLTRVVLQERKGETGPPTLLFTPGYRLFNRQAPKYQYLIEPLIPRGCFFSLNGFGSTWKTWIMASMGLCATTGAPFMDKFPCHLEYGLPNSVLFIELEEPEQEAQRKYRWLIQGLGLRPEEIQDIMMGYVVGQAINLNDTGRVDQLKYLIDDLRPDLVMWDSYRRMKTGDENSSEFAQEVRYVLSQLQEIYPSAHGIIHHWRKTSGDKNLDSPGQRARGSLALRDALDVNLEVSRSKEGFGTILQEKNRMGRELPAFNFNPRIVDNEGHARMEYIGGAEENIDAGPSKELLDLLKKEKRSWTQPELRRHFSDRYSPDQVYRAIYKLERERIILVTASKGGRATSVSLRTDLDFDDAKDAEFVKNLGSESLKMDLTGDDELEGEDGKPE